MHKWNEKALGAENLCAVPMVPFVPLLLISKHTYKLLNFFAFSVKSQSSVAPDVALLLSSGSDLARAEISRLRWQQKNAASRRVFSP